MENNVAILLENTAEAAMRAASLRAELALPEVAADNRYYMRLVKELARISPFADAHDHLQAAQEALEKTRLDAANADIEMLSLYKEEEALLTRKVSEAAEEVQALESLIERGGNAPCVLTVKDTASSQFGVDVLHLYAHYLDLSGIAYEVREDKTGGTLTAEGGLGRLHFESGLHKRSDGAACTVTVMPIKQTGTVSISSEEIRVDIFCSTGKGGQNVNKVETAVRITHLPTGTVVTCQDERSQLMNKRRALATLATRLQEAQNKQFDREYVQIRDAQIRDRSNAVRRYDLGKNRLLDLRTGTSVPLKEAMRGNIDALIKAAALKLRV